MARYYQSEAAVLAAGFQPVPLPESGWLYFLLTAAVFAFVGLVVGYLIWRKAAVQAEDAVIEVRRSAAEYEKIKAEVEREEQALAEPK